MKDKLCKFEIKFWMFVDVISVYCWNFDVYVGKNGIEINCMFGFSVYVVIDLFCGLENKGYCVFIDNFYISFILGYYLIIIWICLCGIIRLNCWGFLKDFVKLNFEVWKFFRGYFDWR